MRLEAPTATVEVVAEFRGDPCCTICSKKCAGYDSCRRVFHHLDTCQYKTHPIVDVPRGSIAKSTACIEWLKEANSCRMRRNASEDEVCLASEAQQDEAVEEITVEAVDPFIAAYRACVERTARWASKVQSVLPPFAITLHVPMSIFPNFIPLILLFTGTIKTSFNLCSPELGCLGSSDNFIISLDGWKNI